MLRICLAVSGLVRLFPRFTDFIVRRAPELCLPVGKAPLFDARMLCRPRGIEVFVYRVFPRLVSCSQDVRNMDMHEFKRRGASFSQPRYELSGGFGEDAGGCCSISERACHGLRCSQHRLDSVVVSNGPGDARALVRKAQRASRKNQRLRARAYLAYHPMNQLDGHLLKQHWCSDAFVCRGVFDAVNCQHTAASCSHRNGSGRSEGSK